MLISIPIGTFISESQIVHDLTHMNILREQWDTIFEIRSAKLKKLLILIIPLEIRVMIYISTFKSVFFFFWGEGEIITYIQKST